MDIRKKILIGLSALGILLIALGIKFGVSDNMVGYSVATGYEKNLRTTMTATQSTVPVTSLALKDGEILDIDKLGGKVFLTIEPGSIREEIVMCEDINTSTVSFTSCTRGLAFSGTSTVSVSANRKTHSAGSKVVMSNVHYTYEQYIYKYDTSLMFGDGTNTDMYLIFDTGSTTVNPGFKYTSTTNQLGFRRYGETLYREVPLSLRGSFADYASLPTTDNSAGDIAITTDDDKLYIWDATGLTWVLAGGSSGAGTMYKTEKLGNESESGDLKTFKLNSGSWPDEKFLLVYKNGQLQRIGGSYDYTTTTMDTIEFTYELVADDLVTMIVVSVDLYNPTWTNVTENLLPDVSATHNIGSATYQWNNVWLAGSLFVSGNIMATGTLNIIGTSTLTNAVLIDSVFTNLPTLPTNFPTTNTPISYLMWQTLGIATSSTQLQLSSDSEVSDSSAGGEVIKKRFVVGQKGRALFSVNLKCSMVPCGTVILKRNGFDEKTWTPDTTSYVSATTTEFNVWPGDDVVLYLNDASGRTVYAKEFRAYYTAATTTLNSEVKL